MHGDRALAEADELDRAPAKGQVKIVARPWKEDVALAIAQEIERALGGWQPVKALA